jgi:hypothetical protein
VRKRKRKSIDLSSIYTVDPDIGQKRHGELPPEIMRHFAACFAHAACLGPDPGFYDGPAPKEYDDDQE